MTIVVCVLAANGTLKYAFEYLLIGGVPIVVLFLVSLVGFGVALRLPKDQEGLKNILLALPILTLILAFAIGEYHGP